MKSDKQLLNYKLLPAVYDRNSRGLLRYGLHCETYNLICRLGFSRVFIDDISAWPEHATYLFKLLVSAVFDQNVCGWVWYIIFECHVGTCVRQVLHIQGLQSSRWSTKYGKILFTWSRRGVVIGAKCRRCRVLWIRTSNISWHNGYSGFGDRNVSSLQTFIRGQEARQSVE